MKHTLHRPADSGDAVPAADIRLATPEARRVAEIAADVFRRWAARPDAPAAPPASTAPRATPDGLLDVKQAAAYAGCHPNTVYGAVNSGRLHALYVGRHPRFTLADLHDWLERRR